MKSQSIKSAFCRVSRSIPLKSANLSIAGPRMPVSTCLCREQGASQYGGDNRAFPNLLRYHSLRNPFNQKGYLR